MEPRSRLQHKRKAKMTSIPLYRTALFVPASKERALEKAVHLKPDVLILDLEDGVAHDDKGMARAQAVALLRSGRLDGQRVVIRVNSPETAEGAADLDALLGFALHGVLLPKVESAALLESFSNALDEASAHRGLAVWAMIETARAVLEVEAIARLGSTRRLAALVVGGNDLIKDLRCHRDEGRAAVAYALSRVLMAARAYDLTALDSVYNAYQDGEGCAREAQQARLLGYDGKTVIHPRQIDIVHKVFRPSEGEIDFAQKVVAAFATRPGGGAIAIDGEMIEPLHLVQARRILALAKIA
jgi:citrate lyase subunit beta / citryl-CoA lyase